MTNFLSLNENSHDNESFILIESGIIPKYEDQDDLNTDITKWKKQKGHNLLLVTGFSAESIYNTAIEISKKYDASIIQFNELQHFSKTPEKSKMVSAFFHDRNLQAMDFDKLPNDRYFQIHNMFFDWIVGQAQTATDHLVILEGRQIFTAVSPKKLQSIPIVVDPTELKHQKTNATGKDYSDNSLMGSFIKKTKNIGSKLKNIIHPNKLNESAYQIIMIEAVDVDEVDKVDYTDKSHYLPDDNGKIKVFEDLFKDDPIKKDICYGFSSSHEYEKSEKKKISAVRACLAFVNNYHWTKTDTKIKNIEAFDKPLKQEKVFNIAKGMEKESDSKITPLIVVDKIHGFYWQTKGKKILLDGNHRLGAMKFLNKETTPTYHGSYNGSSERTTKEIISNTMNESSLEEILQGIWDEKIKEKPLYESQSEDFMNDIERVTGKQLVWKAFPVKELVNPEEPVFKELQEASQTKKRKKNQIKQVELSPTEREEVTKKFGKTECSFAKDSLSGHYYCYTHRCRSKLFPSIDDITQDAVDFIGSTG